MFRLIKGILKNKKKDEPFGKFSLEVCDFLSKYQTDLQIDLNEFELILNDLWDEFSITHRRSYVFVTPSRSATSYYHSAYYGSNKSIVTGDRISDNLYYEETFSALRRYKLIRMFSDKTTIKCEVFPERMYDLNKEDFTRVKKMVSETKEVNLYALDKEYSEEMYYRISYDIPLLDSKDIMKIRGIIYSNIITRLEIMYNKKCYFNIIDISYPNFHDGVYQMNFYIPMR